MSESDQVRRLRVRAWMEPDDAHGRAVRLELWLDRRPAFEAAGLPQD